jgi:large subunit ribosomal protein L21
MYAIIYAGGSQQKVAPGDVIIVDKMNVEDGAEVCFDALMVADGENVRVGAPVVEGVKVTGRVVRQVKGKKIIVFKMKAKKDYRKKQGHRQPYTQVEITAING